MANEVYVWYVPFAVDDKFVNDVKKLLRKYDVNFVEIDPNEIEPNRSGWMCSGCKNPALAIVNSETGEVIAAFELL